VHSSMNSTKRSDIYCCGFMKLGDLGTLRRLAETYSTIITVQ